MDKINLTLSKLPNPILLSNRKIWRMNTDYNVNVIMMQKLIVAKNAKWPNFQPFFKLMTKKRIQKHHFVYMMGLLLYRP